MRSEGSDAGPADKRGVAPHRRGGLSLVVFSACVVVALCCSAAMGQTSWQPTGVPNNGFGAYCYDAARERMVFVSAYRDTYEMDSTGAWALLAVGSPRPNYSWFSGVAHDGTGNRVVCYDGFETWHWDGLAWSRAATLPPQWRFLHVVAHQGRGTVMAFGGPNYWDSNDLYEWDGSAWNLVPTTNKPPRNGNFSGSQVYLACAYDARRDKIVLHGSAWVDWTTQNMFGLLPVVWEWDATNGWTSRTVQGSITWDCFLFFDSARGVMTRLQGNPIQTAEWDGGNAWQPVVPAGGSPSMYMTPYGAYDPQRGRFFAGLTSLSGDLAVSYGSQHLPGFEPRGQGCPGTQGIPTLRLTADWTRAWMGRTLSVDLQNLPQSAGFVAIGWSEQRAGAFTLPYDLTPFGMPGCFARVATDLIVPVVGQNQSATLTMPVPQNNALLGVTLYQQGFAIDPAANAAGLTAGNSVRLSVGRL